MGVQEVVGTDEAALDAVVAADVELMALREEEAEIQSRLNAVSLDDKPGAEDAPQPSNSAANDADNDRLAEIYERLAVGFLTCVDACVGLQPRNVLFGMHGHGGHEIFVVCVECMHGHGHVRHGGSLCQHPSAIAREAMVACQTGVTSQMAAAHRGLSQYHGPVKGPTRALVSR